MLVFRPIQLPADRSPLLQLDTSFNTDHIYQVETSPRSFVLREEPVSPPIHKSFALDQEFDEDRMWEYAILAEVQNVVAGFAALRLEQWNRRATIWHLYVAPEHRRSGLGRRLLAELEAYAHANGARCLWLETSNVNYPAIQFYRAAGFRFCGLDQTLYPPDTTAGETALYFARDL